MGKLMKKALPVKEWKPYGDKEFRYKDSSRMATRLIIGTQKSNDDVEQYVMEEIYTDMIPLIENKKVKIHVDLYSTPSFVLELDGKLIIHNMNVEYLKEDTIAILNEKRSTVSNQIRAITELRNNAYSQAVLGRATKVLRTILSEGLDRPLHYDLIRLVLREMYATPVENNDLAKEFATYTKEELVSVYGGLIEKKIAHVATIEPMKSLIEDNVAVEDIEKTLKDEISRRFFEGTIR